MSPQEVEARLAGQPDGAVVTSVLDALRDDPDWTVTEITINGRLVQVELAHEPSGLAYTLSPTRPDRLNGHRLDIKSER